MARARLHQWSGRPLRSSSRSEGGLIDLCSQPDEKLSLERIPIHPWSGPCLPPRCEYDLAASEIGHLVFETVVEHTVQCRLEDQSPDLIVFQANSHGDDQGLTRSTQLLCLARCRI